MNVDWHHELLDQMQFYWDQMLWPRLEGLTDQEYLWEPAQPAWTVRPQPDGTALIDWALEPPEPEPVTTIAWRLCHIAGPCFWMRWSHHFDDGAWTPVRDDWPLLPPPGSTTCTRDTDAGAPPCTTTPSASSSPPAQPRASTPNAPSQPSSCT